MLEQLVSFNWDQVSSWLLLDCQYQKFDVDQIFWSARSQIEYLFNDTS